MVLFPSKDQDIIDRLEEMKETAEEKRAKKGGRNGKSDYIRRLIREDIADNGKQENSVEEYIKLLKRMVGINETSETGIKRLNEKQNDAGWT